MCEFVRVTSDNSATASQLLWLSLRSRSLRGQIPQWVCGEPQ
jgi:hypothetical protein